MATSTYSRIPAHNQVTRRGLIVSALLAPVAATGADFAATSESSVMSAFAEWQAITKSLEGLGEADFEAAIIHRTRLERLILTLHCHTAEDTIIKLFVLTDGAHEFADDFDGSGLAVLRAAATKIVRAS